MTVASRERASSSLRPSSNSSGRPTSSVSALGSRTANTIATGSARSRRATKPRTWREAPSSHWASSTKQRNGRFLGDLRQEGQRPERDQETVGRIPGRQSQRDAQCTLLGLRKAIEPSEHRRAELMEPRKRQLHLGFHSGDLCDSKPGSMLSDCSQQRRLSNARLAPDHQDTAPAIARVV